MTELLGDAEMELWTAWKRASDVVWNRVVAEIAATTGLSSADFSVLSRVVEAVEPQRQQELADAIGWQRSRLSRQLSRMAERGLLERVEINAATVVRATAAGRAVAKRARRVHARAVRAALLDRAPAGPSSPFWKVVDRLAD